MRRIIILLVVSVFVTACAALPTRPVLDATPAVLTATPAERDAQYALVSQGAPLGDHPREAFYGVVTSAQGWDEIRAKVPDALVEAGVKDAQAGKVIYLVAFGGVKGSSGYALDVQKLTCETGACSLTLAETKPAAETVVEPAMTLPYLLIGVPADQFVRGSKVVFIFKDPQGGSIYQGETSIP